MNLDTFKVETNKEDKRELLQLRDLNYVHGSSSASFPGIFSSETPGLKSSGRLIDEGNFLYSGELKWGISKKGINRDSISAMPINFPKEAIRHSEYSFNKKPWDKESAKKKVFFLTRYMEAIMEGRSAAEEFSKKNKFLNTYPYKQLLEIIPQELKIEKRRLKNWDKMNDSDKSFISNSFPVVYGIKYEGEIKSVISGLSREVGILENISPEQLIIFVPKEKIKIVKDYLEEYNITIGNVLEIGLIEKG